jgi:hypothetical protein
MAYELSDKARLLAKKSQKKIQVLVRIDGYDKLLTALPISTFWRVGDPYFIGQVGLVVGGVIEDKNALNYISMQGTTNQITQQITPDKGGASSISSMTIALIDKNSQISRELSSLTPDILSRRCDVFLGFEESQFPDDFVPIFVGSVSAFDVGVGEVKLRITNPDKLKDQEIFLQVKTNLAAAIDSSQTTITVDDVTNMLIGDDALTSYVKIDEEIIRYQNIGVLGKQLLVCSRGQLGTIAVAHDDDAEVETFYTLSGNVIDVALKVLMSTGTRTIYYVENYAAVRKNIDKVYIRNKYFQEDFNVQVGDKLFTTGFTNNLVDRLIVGVQSDDIFTTIQFDISVFGPEADETVDGFISLISQFNTLRDGAAVAPYQIDIDQFLSIKQRIGSTLPNITYYVKEDLNVRDFIDTLLFPVGGYSLPRKGKISLGYVATPSAETNTRVLSKDNIINAERVQVNRSVDKNFYNAVVFRYDESPIEDKFRRGIITISSNSQNNIKVGNKPLKIDAGHLRLGSENFINAQAQRFLERYENAGESIKIEVFYDAGWSIEVGDTCIVDGTDLNLFDSKTNSRAFAPRIFEVVNKSLSISTGTVVLDLLDTTFVTNGRYVSYAPSSKIKAGSTTTNIILENSLGLQLGEVETDRWSPFLREKIKIVNSDYSLQYETIIRSVIPDSLNARITIDAIPQAPTAGWVVLVADYDSNARNKFKPLFGFFNPYVEVVSGTSNTVFTVADASRLFIDAYVRVERYDYQDLSPEVQITDIVGTTITVNGDLGFTPNNSQIVQLIGFVDDKGSPYRYS